MLAMGMLLSLVLKQQFQASGDPDKASRELLDLCEQLGGQTTFEGVDPALSDHAAQEFRDTLIRLVLRARSLATGEPVDPDAYRKGWHIDRS
jgi:predicted Ser/Thr protein kinase